MKTAQGRSPVEAAARAHSVEVYASFLLPRLAGAVRCGFSSAPGSRSRPIIDRARHGNRANLTMVRGEDIPMLPGL